MGKYKERAKEREKKMQIYEAYNADNIVLHHWEDKAIRLLNKGNKIIEQL